MSFTDVFILCAVIVFAVFVILRFTRKRLSNKKKSCGGCNGCMFFENCGKTNKKK